MDLESMFEQKLSELQRGNSADSLKAHEKYVELEEHIQNAIQAAEGWGIQLFRMIGLLWASRYVRWYVYEVASSTYFQQLSRCRIR